MEIKDLQARQGQVDIIAQVTEKGDVREFEKFGKKGRVCNAKIKDSSGEITLTLWNEQVDQVNVGSKIHIINGWVSEWQGEKQLSTGKFGQLEVLEEGSEKPATNDKKPAEGGEEDTGSEEGQDEEIIKDEEEIVY
ncbi:hypothetical protein KY366_02535 [Candidatus Woesearchaeota archaeon]|nr:hypothetical protein [Candidatus Woesearchaeota archaeon]